MKRYLHFPLAAFFFTLIATQNFAQSFTAQGSTTLVGINQSGALSPFSVGIGVNPPTANFHVQGTVRFSSITNSDAQTRVLVQDINGNIYYRNASTLGTANAWLTGGNTLTGGEYIGTNNATDFRIATNTSTRMVIGANGNVGIGTNTTVPNVRFQVTDGAVGPLPHIYETGVIERTADAKLGIFSSTTNPLDGNGYTVNGVAVTLGYSNYVNASNRYPGFEMQYGIWSATNVLRFNYTEKDATTGTVNTGAGVSNANTMVLTQTGRLGINLGNVAGTTTVPVLPTAILHTNGNVRLQNLPTGIGDIVYINGASGELRRQTPQAFAKTVIDQSSEVKQLKEDIASLKYELEALKNQLSSVSSRTGALSLLNVDLPSLSNNVPNPFSSRTVINYSLPSSFSNSASYINVSDASGNILKQYRIQYTGKGNIPVGELANLSSGTYLYSLVIDGKIYDTKKMIKAK